MMSTERHSEELSQYVQDLVRFLGFDFGPQNLHKGSIDQAKTKARSPPLPHETEDLQLEHEELA